VPLWLVSKLRLFLGGKQSPGGDRNHNRSLREWNFEGLPTAPGSPSYLMDEEHASSSSRVVEGCILSPFGDTCQASQVGMQRHHRWPSFRSPTSCGMPSSCCCEDGDSGGC